VKEVDDFNRVGLRWIELVERFGSHKCKFKCCEFWEKRIDDILSVAFDIIEGIREKFYYDGYGWWLKLCCIMEKLIVLWEKNRCNQKKFMA
jgi:hypothetical protein